MCLLVFFKLQLVLNIGPFISTSFKDLDSFLDPKICAVILKKSLIGLILVKV